MSKTIAPLLSFGASGAIAKTQVYSTWKGRAYARRYVIPANPNTAEQQLTRSVFAWLNQVWKFSPASMTDAFDAYAQGQVMTGRNAFIKQNLSGLREEADLANFIFSPGARSGIASPSLVLTPGNDEIQAVLTAPALPVGWTIAKAQFAAIRDQDPNTGVLYTVTAAEDAATPFDVTISGLVSAVTYYVGGWFEFTRPDGKTAYGRSISDSALTT